MAQLFDYDPVTKTTQLFHWDETEEAAHLETLQDVTPVVELTQAEYNAMSEKAPWKSINKVASIPMSIVGELMRSGVWYDDKALTRWIKDRDNLKFRTRPGSI